MASPLDQDALDAALAEAGYFADEGLVTALYLALELGKPLLLEGMPGVGKTEVGNVLARLLGRDCIRLQCYEGIDASRALYDWDHVRQLLHVRVAERAGPVATAELYAPEFLVEMPLLKALRNAGTAILLIDEIDRADDAFEAFLLEFLSDFQISIPELGTVRAAQPVVTILTSNRTRELHDALRRRCLYHWIDYPDRARERAIVERHAPGIAAEAADRLVEAVAAARRLPLVKRPGIAESIDWARGAMVLERDGAAWPDALRRALGLLVKDPEDRELLRAGRAGMSPAEELLAGFPAALRAAGLPVDPARGADFLRAVRCARLRDVADLARIGRVDADRIARGVRGLRRGVRGLVRRRGRGPDACARGGGRGAAARPSGARGAGAAGRAAPPPDAPPRPTRSPGPRRSARQARTSAARSTRSGGTSRRSPRCAGAAGCRRRPDRASTCPAPPAPRGAPSARRSGSWDGRARCARGGCCCSSTSRGRCGRSRSRSCASRRR